MHGCAESKLAKTVGCQALAILLLSVHVASMLCAPSELAANATLDAVRHGARP